MYLSHWGLARSPFIGPGVAWFEGESQAEALARLRFAVRGRRCALVTGASGIGKTTVANRFVMAAVREGARAAAVDAGASAPQEALWQAAGQFSLGASPTHDLSGLHRLFAEFAADLSRRDQTAALVVDRADHMNPDLRGNLLRLLECGESCRPWLSLVLVGRSFGPGRAVAELLDRIDVPIELEPWSEAEMTGYVQHALVDAGCDRPAFDDEALSVLYALSDGVPRRVNRLADHALLAAAAQGLEQVDAATVEAAHDALAVGV